MMKLMGCRSLKTISSRPEVIGLLQRCLSSKSTLNLMPHLRTTGKLESKIFTHGEVRQMSTVCSDCFSNFSEGKGGIGLGQFKYGPKVCVRTISSGRGNSRRRNQTVLLYICAVGIGMVGMTYAGVPLYRIFCQATGLGGQPVRGHDVTKVGDMSKVDDRVIRVQFNADTASSMQWNFRPQQSEVRVAPGETALAFYTAKNPTDKPITGISTYNVVPFEAGQYFNKIQCFCFEEQRLNPHEKVDMPVFFFIDPEFAEDPKMEGVDRIILSYTFFEAKEGFEVPVPPYLQHWRTTA